MAYDIPHKKIAISRLAHHYYLYDLESISYLRKHHNILGNFIGTLPQHSQQNVFLGLPLELLAEEARLLVEEGIAYIVDDLAVHTKGLKKLSRDDRDRYRRGLEKHGRDLARDEQQRRDESKKDALQRMAPEQRAKVMAKLEEQGTPVALDATEADARQEAEQSLFGHSSPAPSTTSAATSSKDPSIVAKCITPTTSHPPLPLPTPPPSPSAGNVKSDADSPNPPFSPFSPKQPLAASSRSSPSSRDLPSVPNLASYTLFRHLHNHGYFQSPGLRFGCQYCVYPGDPLRFHSHFLARGYGWREPMRLMDIVGGGRLGTGVKKSFLIGGPVEKKVGEKKEGKHREVRAFCVEWAGM